ncbi:MAG: cobalt ECF transporter T component CbiQ [Marinobacterium sp.]|nr:cobalt ECF transporter T component CbiQ [Marinobacterium sp.]
MPQALEHSGTSWKGQSLKHSRSWIDKLDPRLRIVAAASFASVVVLSNAFTSLIIGLLLAILVAVLAKLSFRRTARRVIAMDLFMIFLILVLPFTTPVPEGREPLLTLAGLQASTEGLLHALAITLKANAVILVMLSLVGTLNATTLGQALARLKMPDKLVHLMLFTVRYMDVIGQEYKRMRRAMQARAFVMGTNRHTWRAIGYLVGMLLVHALERSERILAAMKCRGFNGRFYLLDQWQLTWLDYLAGSLWACLLVLLAAANLL